MYYQKKTAMNEDEKFEQIGLHFGPLQPKISTQCHRLGYVLSGKADVIDELNDDINALYMADILNEKEMQKCCDRLFNVIKKNLKKVES